MPYYDRIAKQWHSITGYSGGSFKRLILNDKILSKTARIEDKAILEIGSGNGYFMKLLLKKFSGQIPSKIIISDVSKSQLELAKKHFYIPDAEYLILDVYKKFPISDNNIDLILSTMVYNEVTDKGLINAINESKRILKHGGRMITAVLHPDFIDKQVKQGVIKSGKMIANKGIRVPVLKRSMDKYREIFEKANLKSVFEDVYGNTELYNEKPVLRKIKNIPIALIIESNYQFKI